MIEEEFVSFDTAQMLKEAGFEANLKTRYVEEEKDEWAFWDSGTERSDYNYFDDTITCPTQALAARCMVFIFSAIISLKIDYEADLLIITKSGYCTEYEIKRYYSDFLADMKKDECAHKAPWVYKFYYVIPLSIKDKVLKYFEDKGITECDVPGILCYSERGSITSVGGIPYIKGGRKMFLEEMLKVARLGTLRYWNLRNKGGNNE